MQRRFGQQDRRVGILEDELDACRWVTRIDRKVGAAGFQGGQNPDDHVHRTVNEQSDQAIRVNAKTNQRRGQHIGTAVEFLVAQRVSFETDRRTGRRALDLLFNQPMKGFRSLPVNIHNEAPITSFMISLVPA